MIEQRAKEFLLLDHFGADESKRLADFAEREITPYREALRALVESVADLDFAEYHLHDEMQPFRKALADAAALLEEGEKG